MRTAQLPYMLRPVGVGDDALAEPLTATPNPDLAQLGMSGKSDNLEEYRDFVTP